MRELILAIFLLSNAAHAEDIITEGSFTFDESVAPNYAIKFESPPEIACIVTEICGDAAENSDVRCVRITVCGEPVR